MVWFTKGHICNLYLCWINIAPWVSIETVKTSRSAWRKIQQTTSLSTVHKRHPRPPCPFPNLFWEISQLELDQSAEPDWLWSTNLRRSANRPTHWPSSRPDHVRKGLCFGITYFIEMYFWPNYNLQNVLQTFPNSSNSTWWDHDSTKAERVTQTQLNHSKGGWVAFLGCNVRIGHLWTATLLRVFVW